MPENTPNVESSEDIARHLITLEEQAMRRWCDGDPSGFLEISAEDVVYFDPFLKRRIDGLPALTAHYESLRGKIFAERFEFLNPRVQVVGEAAVLTYNYVSHGRRASHWNCTEVFRCTASRWLLIQSHWSLTNAGNSGG